MKRYVIPSVESIPYQFKNLMKVASDEPIDPGTPGNSLPAPTRRAEVF